MAGRLGSGERAEGGEVVVLHEAPLHRALPGKLPGAIHALTAFGRSSVLGDEPLRSRPAPGVFAGAPGVGTPGFCLPWPRADRGAADPVVAGAAHLGFAAPALPEVFAPRPEAAAPRLDLWGFWRASSGSLGLMSTGETHGDRWSLAFSWRQVAL